MPCLRIVRGRLDVVVPRRARRAAGALAVGLSAGTLAACGVLHLGQQPAAAPEVRKVLLLMEENSDPGEVDRAAVAPYLNGLADQAATLTDMDAGYPASCPSLPGYLLVTSGSTHGVCDDHGPEEHQLDGQSIFSEVVGAGQEWRVFAESMRTGCQREDSEDGRYLVRHTAAPYFRSETERCPVWQVPMGSPAVGQLASALDAGLPALTVMVPDRCHDMHGGDACEGDRVEVGDQWLRQWVPVILRSADYRSGDLLVIITWDEAHDDRANHIPTFVLHPSVVGTTMDEPRDHCSTLRTMTDWLGLEPFGCAAGAEPLVPVVGR